MEQFEDKLEVLGLAIGVLLVLIGLGTIVGQPWATQGSLAATLGQLFGAVAAIAVGAGLAWITRTGEMPIAEN